MSVTKRRIEHLDGLRGAAMLMVLCIHWLAPKALNTPVHLVGGYIGADVFFVLSGYLIAGGLLRSPQASVLRSFQRFQRGRVKRLVPALAVFLVVTVILVAVVGQPVSPQQGLVNGLLAALQLGSWTNALQLTPLHPFDQTWTLSVEWYYYLAAPLALLWFRNRGRYGTPRSRALVVLGVAAVLWLASTPWTWQWFYYGSSSRMAQLLSGAAVALFLWRPNGEPAPVVTARQTRWFTVVGAVTLVAMAVYTVAGPPLHENWYKLLAFPLTTAGAVVLVMLGQYAPEAPVTRVLCWRPLKFVGHISYSLYLWHMLPVDLIVPASLPDFLPVPVATLLSLVALAAIVTFSYVVLERRPGSAAKRKAVSSTVPAQRTAASSPSPVEGAREPA